MKIDAESLLFFFNVNFEEYSLVEILRRMLDLECIWIDSDEVFVGFFFVVCSFLYRAVSL